MKIYKLVLIIIAPLLSACSHNHGFPKEMNSPLKPINAQQIKDAGNRAG